MNAPDRIHVDTPDTLDESGGGDLAHPVNAERCHALVDEGTPEQRQCSRLARTWTEADATTPRMPLCIQHHRMIVRRTRLGSAATGDARARRPRAMRALIPRAPRRGFTVAGLVLGFVIVGGIWLTQRGSSAEAAPGASVKASRGDVVLSVGGVGRIVTGSGAAAIEVPAAAASGSTSGSSSSATADAVFPHTSGHVERFLVKPGQHVVAGQPIAVLGDNGAAASAVRQAELDLETARIELRQRLESDPSKGTPATAAETTAARAAIRSARADLAQALGPTRRADLTAAQLDLSRARADLQTLLGGDNAARTRAIALAVDRVTAAQKRLDRILAPSKPTDISAAQAEVKKAEADLALLQRPPVTPLPAELAAAQNAVTIAQQNLAAAQAAVPPDPAAVSTARLELDTAVAALATLQQPALGPLAQEIASAQAALDAALTKLAALQGPPDAAEVATGRQELAQAQAELRTLRAGPSAAGLAAARRAVTAARAKLTQVRRPAAGGAERLAVLRAEAEMAALRARSGPASPSEISLARVKYSAAAARLATARRSQRQLTVRAPSAGTVASLLTVRGAPADGSTAIASITNLDRLAVRVDLSEFDVARVKPGLRSVVSVDALGGETFRGRVVFAALAGTDNNGVVSFPVTVGLSEVEGPRPGMNVSVRIIIAERHDVVQVPIEAVSRDDEDRPSVAVVGADGESTPRSVTVGLANNKSIEIVRGLRVGERVAVEASAGAAEEE